MRLDSLTALGQLWKKEGDRVRCVACAHRCLLGEGRRGICKVRFQQDGQLRVPYGYVAGLASDPIEKKPFFHLLPGSLALTFGMLGCDFHCAYCQNWLTSQSLRDAEAGGRLQPLSPEHVARAARQYGARVVVSSYNEPLITAEWAAAIFAPAQAAGLLCACVSNGHATPEAIDFLRPCLAALKVDLKTCSEERYRQLGGRLGAVLDTIREAHRRDLWVEVVTLVVPGFNDEEAELRQLARFLASVSPDIPWHVTAFHPDYQMTDPPPTPVRQLVKAAQLGADEGLRFVYAGNLPGRVGPWENTVCPKCGETLVQRYGFQVSCQKLTPDGRCPRCQQLIPGKWSAPGVGG
jgi:pyruvate formate lyase activating enzyme